MNLFQMKSNPLGIERIAEYLEDNFVSIGLPDIGDLEIIGEAQVRVKLEQVYKSNEQELMEQLKAVHLFVHMMQDGDYVLVAEHDFVHLGDLGDYFYHEESGTPDSGLCHRRGVTWLARIPLADMNSEVQELLAQPQMITRFKYPIDRAQLYRWSSNLLEIAPPTATADKAVHIQVDDDIVEEALQILREAMRSNDTERRERAAIAVLQYYGQAGAGKTS
jgi:predicted Mrr-cat superfamily restriction endonuclease